MRLRLDSGEVVLAADACYFCQTLRERRLPRNMYDREAMLASLDRLEALGKIRRANLLQSRPGFLAVRAASSCCHRMRLPCAILGHGLSSLAKVRISWAVLMPH